MPQLPLIKIKDLSVTYFIGRPNEVRALKAINLEIYQGEFIIFFGPSGCGKSTLLYAISGLETGISGEIFVDGNNVSAMNRKELEFYHQKKTGMIFQAYYLINSLSSLQNVVLPRIAIGEDGKEMDDEALALMEKFGVKAQANKFPNELSGGQQQRIAICRSVINNPDIVFADEPVGNLDTRSANEVMTLLKELNTKQGKTIILVTHNPAHLNLAHRVFYMKDGEVESVKINEAINMEVAKEEKVEMKPTISKELELLARSFSSIASSPGSLLAPFKAKEITAEALTGITIEEIGKIERRVESLLLTGINDDGAFFRYLDDEEKKGGMGFDKRTARVLADKIKSVAGEIKLLKQKERSAEFGDVLSDEVNEIRHHLLDAFKIEIKDQHSLNAMNQAIRERLENKIDGKTLQMKLDLPAGKGGAGLNKKAAQKAAKRVELLILGKYE